MDTPRLFVRVRADHDLGVFLREDTPRDHLLLPFHRCAPHERDLRAFPMDHNTFIRSPQDLHCLMRHGCMPSAYVDWEGLSLRAIRELHEGEEITINYQTVYEVVPSGFLCECADAECYREIRGFRFLTLEQKLRLELYLSPYLKRLLNEEVRAIRATAS